MSLTVYQEVFDQTNVLFGMFFNYTVDSTLPKSCGTHYQVKNVLFICVNASNFVVE